jgi:hypothetical protein
MQRTDSAAGHARERDSERGSFLCEDGFHGWEAGDGKKEIRTTRQLNSPGCERLQAKCADYLRQLAYFRGLSDEACEALASRLRVVVVAPGVTLFHQGERGTSLYIIFRGALSIEFNSLKVDQRLSGYYTEFNVKTDHQAIQKYTSFPY